MVTQNGKTISKKEFMRKVIVATAQKKLSDGKPLNEREIAAIKEDNYEDEMRFWMKHMKTNTFNFAFFSGKDGAAERRLKNIISSGESERALACIRWTLSSMEDSYADYAHTRGAHTAWVMASNDRNGVFQCSAYSPLVELIIKNGTREENAKAAVSIGTDLVSLAVNVYKLGKEEGLTEQELKKELEQIFHDRLSSELSLIDVQYEDYYSVNNVLELAKNNVEKSITELKNMSLNKNATDDIEQ